MHGELPRIPCVGIVGTRHPTEDAAVYARHLSGALAAAGVAIVSGGAAGVDTAAHLGALDVGGVGVVVAPCGFERPFPACNADLFRRVVEGGGAYVSLVAPGVAATRGAFFPRNAVLVALCHALILVEAPVRSGARNAACVARKIGRPVFVVPGVPWNPAARGSNADLGLGARLLDGPRTVLRWLASQLLHPLPLEAGGPPAPPPGPPPLASPPGPRAARGPGKPRRVPDGRPFGRSAGAAQSGPDSGKQPGLFAGSSSDPDVLCLLEAVRSGAANADAVCQKTGLGAARVQHLLLTLELEGVLVADSEGRLKLISH